MVSQLTTYCEELMQEERYDLFMVVYTNTDMANHFFRKYLDRTYPTYDTHGAEMYGDVLLNQYQRADEAVGKLLEQTDSDTTVLIMSDHGSGVHSTRYFHTNSWLDSKGWFAVKGGLSTRAAKQVRRVLEAVRIRTPWARDFVKRRFPGVVKRSITAGLQGTTAADWSATKAYRVPMFYFVEGIEINLKGRQPQGVVEPGREYEDLREEIIAELSTLRDPDTGKRVVREAIKKEQEYSGPLMDKAPDIVVFYDHDLAGGPNPSGPLITPIEQVTLKKWSGLHRMNGTLIMWGQDVQQGVAVEGANIVDLAPTILYLLGLPIPADMDGQVLTQALDPALPSSRPIRREKRVGRAEQIEPGGYLDAKEEEEIKDALRGLGYIE
jgi:predicted AlkP superfamily phosphohydrolase/phosphomutase